MDTSKETRLKALTEEIAALLYEETDPEALKTLEGIEKEVETYDVETCCHCGVSLSEVPVEQWLARQVFDLLTIELRVTEHQVAVKCCQQCGQQNQGSFPVEANNVVQYGPRLKGMMVYLMESQLLPSARPCEVLSDLVVTR